MQNGSIMQKIYSMESEKYKGGGRHLLSTMLSKDLTEYMTFEKRLEDYKEKSSAHR